MKNLINKIKQNKLLKILFMTLKAIVTLIIILVVSIIFIQRISHNKLTLGGYSIFTVITESMVPKYQVGDMLFAKEINPSEIVVGDDVVYKGNYGTFKDKIITHRVIDIENTANGFLFHTKGIANTIEDPVVNEDQIYGRIVGKSIVLSFLSKIVNNIYGFYFIVFIPFVVMIFIEMIDVIHPKDKEK